MYQSDILLSLLIPFLGTCFGAAGVFFLRRELPIGARRGLTGFASGVMVAASVWSLLIPAMEANAAMGSLAFLPSVAGFWGGTLFLLLLDRLIPHLHMDTDEAEGLPVRLPRTAMLLLAVTLHNIPEGMAVGVMLAGLAEGFSRVTPGAALALSLGIAIQNFPEGAIISLPLRAGGASRFRSFFAGVLSGAVEPVGGALTILASSLIVPALPYFLSFAAGAMMYVVVEELIPEMSAGPHSDIGVVCFSTGFTVMMALDTALG